MKLRQYTVQGLWHSCAQFQRDGGLRPPAVSSHAHVVHRVDGNTRISEMMQLYSYVNAFVRARFLFV